MFREYPIGIVSSRSRRGKTSSMYEIKNIRQDDPALLRRWYRTENGQVELFTWENKFSGDIEQFQFYYLEEMTEKAVVWKVGQPLWLANVDYGRERKLFKDAPVLIASTDIDLEYASNMFILHSKALSEELVDFVYLRLQDFEAGSQRLVAAN